MSFDSTTIYALVNELNSRLIGGRIDKIHQPANFDVYFSVRNYTPKNQQNSNQSDDTHASRTQKYNLLLSCNPNFPRIYLTEKIPDRPYNPPMFCMLLRKHLLGGKILGFKQHNFDRVIELQVETRSELGDILQKSLYIEVMGRYSNIILVDNESKILGANRVVDLSVSSKRIVIGGVKYQLAPPQDGKINPLNLNDNQPLLQNYAEKYIGISNDTSEYIANNTLNLKDFLESLKTPKPSIEFDDDTPKKFAVYDLSVRKNQDDTTKILSYPTISQMLSTFYNYKLNSTNSLVNASDLLKKVNTIIARLNRKYKNIQNDIKNAEDYDDYKLFGELLTANIYKKTDNASKIELLNYYDDSIIEIPLDVKLNIAQNAEKYYKIYNKKKNALVQLSKQLEVCDKDREYLSSVANSIENCDNEDDIFELEDELAQGGYIVLSHAKNHKRAKNSHNKSKPIHLKTPNGANVYIGKNNLQNDHLTLKQADKRDLWFHVKNIPGSHCILQLDGKNPADDDIIFAATACARHSKAKNSSKVEVDFTTINNVKKPRGAKPGMVIYDNFKTIVVKLAD
ncbi:MAG: NFACT family protein [Clostridiales bacterium]|jgi:predicted ribosome quality control (RQC) complex YloA/Tae2 family protein|nr:NFACT family protein [Clostridiales bacterium]